MVPADERHLPLWRCFDLLLQQLALQSAMGGLDPTGADPRLGGSGGGGTKLDWEELLARLRTESECEQLERKLHETEKELAEERRRALELENRLSDLQDSASLNSFSRLAIAINYQLSLFTLQSAYALLLSFRVSEHSSTASTSPSDPCHSPPPPPHFNSTLPPIRPPLGVAPPPPPPSALQLRSVGGSASGKLAPKKLGVPTPIGAVKTLNWTPIGADKIKETIWADIDEQKFYKQACQIIAK